MPSLDDSTSIFIISANDLNAAGMGIDQMVHTICYSLQTYDMCQHEVGPLEQ